MRYGLAALATTAREGPAMDGCGVVVVGCRRAILAVAPRRPEPRRAVPGRREVGPSLARMASPLLPTFAVVGAQKAGSTDLAASLAQHPDVFLPPDEVPFFEDPFFAASDPAELTRALEPGRDRRHRGIKRPDYLGRPECADHLAATVPDLLVLVCLRDPVDRALSAYYWYVKNRMLPLLPADEGLARLLDGDLPTGHPHAGEVLAYGRYAHHLRRYRDRFPPKQVHVVLYDDLRAGPEALDAVHRFLGVAPHRPAPDRSTNPGVYDPRRLRWLRAGDRFRFDWDAERTYTWRPRRRRRPLAALPHLAVVGVDRVVLARVLGNARPPLDHAVRARLRAFYADDLAALPALIGRPLPEGWTQDP